MKKVVNYFNAWSLVFILCKPRMKKTVEDEKKGGFKKENLFTGGGATVSVGSYSTFWVQAPYLGYSITKWLDAGIVFNFNMHLPGDVYYDIYGNIVSDDKSRQTVLGPGVFARVYPLKFLFLNIQAEQNFITDKIIYAKWPNSKR